METPAIKRAINRYFDAVVEAAFEGSIPVIGGDRKEQEYLDDMHASISRELARSRELMVATIMRAARSN